MLIAILVMQAVTYNKKGTNGCNGDFTKQLEELKMALLEKLTDLNASFDAFAADVVAAVNDLKGKMQAATDAVAAVQAQLATDQANEAELQAKLDAQTAAMAEVNDAVAKLDELKAHVDQTKADFDASVAPAPAA